MNRPSGEPSDHPLSLEGKGAVVTGTGQGIGRRVAERFAAAGAQVLVGDLDEGSAGTAASELSDELGREVVGLGVDVSSEDSEHLNVIRAVIPDPDTDVGGLVRDLQGPDAEAEPVDERIKLIEAKAEIRPARRAANGARLGPSPWPEAMEPPC